METDDDKRQRNERRRDLHNARAGMDYVLEVFGDELARRHEYTALDGLDAVRYYLMQKHDWLPCQVRAMSTDDMRFALNQEISGWTLPPEARF